MSLSFLDALGESLLYPLTDRVISGLTHHEQVSRLSDMGITLVQLREKSLTAGEFYREAAEALQVARELAMKIIINDRVDIALALSADGVHLGQDDMPADAARRLLGQESIIGISTHNLEQAQRAADMSVDYVAIGPIFPTNTKESLNQPVGLHGLSVVRKALGNKPLVAIGGITSSRRQQVLAAGADAIALISGIWSLAPSTRG